MPSGWSGARGVPPSGWAGSWTSCGCARPPNASPLGANLIIEESDDLPTAVAEVARRQRTTYILLGASRPRRGLGRLRTPLPQRLMELLPGVDVRIVADRSRLGEGAR